MMAINRSHFVSMTTPRFRRCKCVLVFFVLLQLLGGLAQPSSLLSTVKSPAKHSPPHRAARFLQTEGGDGNNNVAVKEEEEQDNDDATCPPCPQCANPDISAGGPSATEPLTLQILVVDSQGIVDMVAWNARDYEAFTGGKVRIEIKKAPTMPALFEEIENDARSGGGLFDAYYTNPVILGTAAILNGFLDLTPFVKESQIGDWTDVLLALRNYVTSFEEKIYIILLDGDTHTLFYRKDVLEAFGLKPPRTWNEYTAVAKAVHGKTFNGTKLSGSCVSRIQGDHAMYWSHLVLSTITQTEGTAKGSLFDTQDMTPLTGEAFAEMLRIHEEHAKYGTPDEFELEINLVQNESMNRGNCVLTYMWGDLFRRSKAEGSILHDKLGIAPTPGSEFVLNRKTGRLERCTRELCPYGEYYPDIGFVNRAPYAANGGWGAAVSANTTPEKQKALAEFFLWASSKEQSQQYVIPNATLPWYEINGQDPWRKSQLDVDKWVAQGFNRELSKQFVDSIMSNLVSKNVVVEARFPKAGEIMSVIDKEVNEYLVRARDGSIAEADKPRERLNVARSVTDQWNQIIKSYNERGDTIAPILEIYQRLRGVYVPNEEKNLLTRVRPMGLTLMAIIAASSLGAAAWVVLKRRTRVVRASQPPFLGLICIGTLVMGSSIYTMGIDDGVASQRGCSMACMATPWLVTIGFSQSYAALFSKIWRLNILMKSAAQLRRVQVTAQDVLLPFVVLMGLNVIFLLTWTLVDPLYWERVDSGRTGTGELASYGRCTSDGAASLVLLGLIGAVNLTALLLANIQAYQTRNLFVAFNESQYVGLSMASILQACLVGVPLLFLANTNPTARYVVRSLLVFVVCMSMLAFIFLPKILGANNDLDDLSGSNRAPHRASSWNYSFNARASSRHSATWEQQPSRSGELPPEEKETWDRRRVSWGPNSLNGPPVFSSTSSKSGPSTRQEVSSEEGPSATNPNGDSIRETSRSEDTSPEMDERARDQGEQSTTIVPASPKVQTLVVSPELSPVNDESAKLSLNVNGSLPDMASPTDEKEAKDYVEPTEAVDSGSEQAQCSGQDELSACTPTAMPKEEYPQPGSDDTDTVSKLSGNMQA